MSATQHGRRVGDRRTGEERRGSDRRALPLPADEGLLGRFLPYAQLHDPVAISAHRVELETRLARDPGQLVAALDYLLNISHELVAPAVVEQEVLAVLERRSITDPLTGLFNRFHFEATLTREVARSARHPTELSLLLLDVDQLKAVNDRWGHHAGDRVLRRVAAAIRQSARSSDVTCRYGGDEFAIILPNTDAQGARAAAERICALVGAALPDAGGGTDVSLAVTVSGGLAQLPPTAGEQSEVELVVAADEALYLAKRSGRNCVITAGQHVHPPVLPGGEANP
ncbi:MAG TPA: GGDEF domain-containing protein [Gemmatimonadales bacterium]|nr:GGDEF domain-containing protein [Gemmatimonadales bacterium]